MPAPASRGRVADRKMPSKASAAGPPGGARAVRILGRGSPLRAAAVWSAELDGRLGLARGTVEKRTGVRVRYFETRGNAAALGAEAARRGLAAGGPGLSAGDALC